MTGAELHTVRKQLRLSWRELGLALGYRDTPNLRTLMRQYENGRKIIPPDVAEDARKLLQHQGRATCEPRNRHA